MSNPIVSQDTYCLGADQYLAFLVRTKISIAKSYFDQVYAKTN